MCATAGGAMPTRSAPPSCKPLAWCGSCSCLPGRKPSPAGLSASTKLPAAMHGLLTRLIGENIALDLHLDPELGAGQNRPGAGPADPISTLFLTLATLCLTAAVLPSRPATASSNPCGRVPSGPPAFPCVLLAVGDNGHGMNAETRQRLFEPFFTTKNAGQGTGLGLTTVRSIVTTNRGLIHFESEPGRGTRVMILLPRASQPADSDLLDPANPDSGPLATPSQEIKKESLL